MAVRPFNQTGVRLNVLHEVGEALINVPKDFVLHKDVANLIQQRERMIETGEGINMAFAEALAFGCLLKKFNPTDAIGKRKPLSSPSADGTVDSTVATEEAGVSEGLLMELHAMEGKMPFVEHPTIHIRLSGQDSIRGTFNQRHAVIVCQQTGREFWPFSSLGSDCASFSVYNSNLCELSALGYEYGYSIGNELALVLWEAQFGDFANMAQSIIDNFISSGESKWHHQSSMVLLLPHGYEGQGPDHTSARLERLLQLVNEDDEAIPGNNYYVRKEMEAGFDALYHAHGLPANTSAVAIPRRLFVESIATRYSTCAERIDLTVAEILEEYTDNTEHITKEIWCVTRCEIPTHRHCSWVIGVI